MTRDTLTTARAAALFASHLSAHAEHPTIDIAAAIAAAMRQHGGTPGCAAQVAAEYGERPELAAARMRWARRTIEAAFASDHLKSVKEQPCLVLSTSQCLR